MGEGSFSRSSAEEQVEENIEPAQEAVDDGPEHAAVLRPGNRDREGVAKGEAVADAGAVIDRCHGDTSEQEMGSRLTRVAKAPGAAVPGPPKGPAPRGQYA